MGDWSSSLTLSDVVARSAALQNRYRDLCEACCYGGWGDRTGA